MCPVEVANHTLSTLSMPYTHLDFTIRHHILARTGHNDGIHAIARRDKACRKKGDRINKDPLNGLLSS